MSPNADIAQNYFWFLPNIIFAVLRNMLQTVRHQSIPVGVDGRKMSAATESGT